jgi:hypothetical protein
VADGSFVFLVSEKKGSLDGFISCLSNLTKSRSE